MIALRAVLGLAAALAVTGPAVAQLETNSSAPIDITANEAEVINAKCLAIWRGAAEALQGDARLRADTITVYEAAKGGTDAAGQRACGATEKVVAEGHVYYVTPTQNARGDRAVYSAAADQIVMTGDVIVVRGDDVARGDRLVIKVASKQFIMESSAHGTGTGRRVRGVFYPNKTTASGQAQPGGQ